MWLEEVEVKTEAVEVIEIEWWGSQFAFHAMPALLGGIAQSRGSIWMYYTVTSSCLTATTFLPDSSRHGVLCSWVSMWFTAPVFFSRFIPQLLCLLLKLILDAWRGLRVRYTAESWKTLGRSLVLHTKWAQ